MGRCFGPYSGGAALEDGLENSIARSVKTSPQLVGLT
jgi:hypothetical protein